MDTTLTLTVNNLWMMICTALVFFMHLGFSLLEIGLTRQKNTVNILFKNFFIICIGLVLYALIGFNLMYPSSFWHGVIPDYFVGLFGLESPQNAEGLDLTYNTGYTYWTDFLFQGMFAALPLLLFPERSQNVQNWDHSLPFPYCMWGSHILL